MSYLLENSIVVTKKEFLEDEEKYLLYESYPIGEHIILTENKKPFFSIFDIANYCKKRYKDDKLFLIVHRYFDNVNKEKITEFYILNTENIFDKSLTSFMYLKASEMTGKQLVLQDNIDIAQKMLNNNNLHIILGDNVKEHEVVEYINSIGKYSNIDIFDDDTVFNHTYNSNFTPILNVKTTRISKILKSIRVIEPKKQKAQKMMFMMLIVFLTAFLSGDYINSMFEEERLETKREFRKLKSTLKKTQKDIEFKQKYNQKNTKIINILKKKKFYDPKSSR